MKQTQTPLTFRLVMGNTLGHRMINLQDAKSALGRGESAWNAPALCAASVLVPFVSCLSLSFRGFGPHPSVACSCLSLLLAGSMERLNPDEKRLARLTALRDLFQVPEDLEAEWVEY
jgi:hypothetical protein